MEIESSKKVVFPLYLASVIFLILFVGLRGDEVGFDYLTYKESFEEIGAGINQNILMEPGYVLLNKLVYPVGPFFFLLLIMALSTISIKSFFIAKYSEYPFLSLLLYFTIAMLIYDMGQIRFGLAISFMMLSYNSMIQGSRIRVCFFWIIALMFHYSSLLALPMLFLYNYKFTVKQVLFLLFFCFCFYVININTVLTSIAVFMPAHIASKIYFYTFYTDTYGQALGFNISLFLRLLILFFFIYYKSVICEYEKGGNIIFNLYFYGVIIYMIFNSNSEFATRGGAYFKILELIILPMFVKLGKENVDKILIWSAIVAYAFYSLSKILFDVEFGQPYHNYTNILLT